MQYQVTTMYLTGEDGIRQKLARDAQIETSVAKSGLTEEEQAATEWTPDCLQKWNCNVPQGTGLNFSKILCWHNSNEKSFKNQH